MTSKTIYKGRVVNLNIDEVTLPNGAIVELETIRHPGAAAVVPLQEDGTVVLIRQFRHAAGGFIYEIPAGKLSPGEEPIACARRELEEEIGYCASNLELLTSIFTVPGFCDEVIHIYKGTGLTPGTQKLDYDEVLEVLTMPLETAIQYIKDGVIRDGKTIVGLQAVYIRNKEGKRQEARG